jgi:hypothetical protein
MAIEKCSNGYAAILNKPARSLGLSQKSFLTG